LEAVRQQIRLDSRAQIRSGGSLIASPVVYINTGTARTRAVAAGDTLRSPEQSDYEGAMAHFALATKGLPEILGNVKVLSAQLTTAQGTLGAFGIEARSGTRTLMAGTSRLASKLSSTAGRMGIALGDSIALQARVRRAMATTDSLRAFLAYDRTSYGRFRSDS